jgi:putative acetyltransferase
MADYAIREDDLTGPEVAALLRLHLDDMHQWSPPESVHAMPIERLRQADVTFFTAWDGAALAACGALKQLDPAHGEIKSMRADPHHRGKGAGRAILLHILSEARSRGYTRLSLETGVPDAFEPARRLYESHGFTRCPPFGDYLDDGFSLCMTRTL